MTGKLLITLAFAANLFAAVAPARAAELIMFSKAGCPWCEIFDREIAPVYPSSAEGARAPLRRVDIAGPLPPDLTYIEVERLTPVFVLVDQGREIGRIRGYPGEAFFWDMLGELIDKLEPAASGAQPARDPEKPLHVNDYSSLVWGRSNFS